MFIELMYPEIYKLVSDDLRYYVGTTENRTGYYLAGDSYLKELPWLFDSFDEAILASAKYYHNNGYTYPWQSEMIDAGKRFLEDEDEAETVESTIMKFE